MESKDIKKFIEQNDIAIVYFSNYECGACPIIKQKVEDIIKNKDSVSLLEISIENNQNLSAEFSVFSTPLAIVYVLGKETTRFGRYVDFVVLENDIDRYIDLLS